MMDYGYGVDMSCVEFKKNAPKHILQNFASKKVLEEFEDFCVDNSDLVEDGIVEEIFVDEYEDALSLASGACGLIVRCINDNECPKADFFAYNDCCIYVGARIPANDTEKSRMLTQEDIRRILTKYLNPILERDIILEWLQIND